VSQRDFLESDTEDILGQFCFALGQGAGTMRIQRDAINALRERYRDAVAAAIDRWPVMAPNILSFVTQVGRVAALQATQAGRTAISAADFMYARQLVESQVHRAGERAHGIFAGPFCPTVPGEKAPESENESDCVVPDDRDRRPAPIVAPGSRMVH
jgi:hypothetical protein